MKKYIKKYYKLFLLAVTFVAIESMFDLLQPNITSNIIDNGVAKNDINYIIKQGGLMFLITFVGAIFAVIRNIISTNVAQRFSYDLRNDLFIKINTYSFDTIEKFNKASLITRITNDVDRLQNFAYGMMRIFIKAPILCIGSLIMAIKLNFKLSLVLLVMIIGVFLIISINLKVGYPLFKRVQKSIDSLNYKLREYLGGVRVVKSFNRYNYEVDKFNDINDELYKSSTKAMRVMGVFSPVITFIVNISIVLVLYLGNMPLLDVKIGIIVAYVNYMTRILTSLIMISHIFNVFVRAKTSFERVNEVLKEDSHISNSLIDLEKIESIEFNNVNFSYHKESKFNNQDINKDKNKNDNITFNYKECEYKDDNTDNYVLKNINMKITKGQHIGIIGPTGSGKTSVINLLPKFYNIDSGSLKINNIDINKINEKSIREKIAIVPQKNTLFSQSIMENIKWGNENATIEDVLKVLEISDAKDFVTSFKDSYNTILGQGGVNVSGGQKQRLSIARALVKNPDVLILDDSTSALDLSTEVKIKNNLKTQLKNLTIITIAQRISSVIDCDNIYVLEEGEIVGSGKHDELMKNCQIYKDIFKSQVNRELM